MAEETATSAIEINDDPAFQRRQWRAERIGWALMAAIVLAALAGLFGNGPAARATAASGDGQVQIDFDRIVRRNAPSQLVLTLTPSDDEVRVEVPREYADRMGLRPLSPLPAQSLATAEGTVYWYSTGGSHGRVRMTFTLHPRTVGRTSAQLIVAERTVSVSQLVLP
jgi:hypothetical protein